MEYLQKPRYHYRPKKGWINDPNGLVYFDGYYHVFYQHAPDFEHPWKQPMHWGHARTKDFLVWEELPVALTPGAPYDGGGCWSGTAIAKDGKLYLFYAAITEVSTVAVAVSEDGIHFQKYENNPVIRTFPPEGGPDFRDPAVCCIDGVFYCVVASGNPPTKTARLLLYRSENLFDWTFCRVMAEWQNGKYAECPSFVPAKEGYLLTTSVCPLDSEHYFSVMYGDFEDGTYTARYIAEVDKGPDQYAGQVFLDHMGRSLLITWIPGWKYSGYAPVDIGCMSVPRELKCKDGKITAYPIAELQHLLKDEDPCLQRTEDGFVVAREGREPLVYRGKIRELGILRDGYIAEIFVNGGEEVFSVLL